MHRPRLVPQTLRQGERLYIPTPAAHEPYLQGTPSVLKNSPIRAQVTERRHEVGQVSPGARLWPGLQEPAQLSYLGCCDHPTTSHECWCIVWWEPPHIWGHSHSGMHGPIAPSAPQGCFRTSMLQGCYRCCPCSPFLGWCLLLLCSPAGECLLPPLPPMVL